MLMEWLKKAPASVVIAVIIVGGVGFIAIVGGFVVLSINGQDTTEYIRLMNSFANWIMLPLMGLGTVASVTAARSASRAEDQTNGQLTARDETIAARDKTIAAHEQTIANLRNALEGRR